MIVMYAVDPLNNAIMGHIVVKVGIPVVKPA